MSTFDRDAIQAFRFVRCGFDADSGVAELAYAFDDGPELVETVTVPGAPFDLDDARAAAAEQALRLLHLIAGVSYYKAAVPQDIRIDGYDKDRSDRLLKRLFLHAVEERFRYRVQWRPHMLTIWDNRSTQHFAINDYHGHRREMFRTSVKGTPLLAA